MGFLAGEATQGELQGELTCHTAMSLYLTQKEPVRYINKPVKKTTDTKLQRILAVNKKCNTG